MSAGRFVRLARAGLALVLMLVSAGTVSAKVILQYFESRYDTIERRMPDVFMAGYDGLWIPPTNRADTGNFSVGYDLFNRFDLGNPFGQTLYGSEDELRQMIQAAHRAGVLVFPDIVLNHNGFRDLGTPGFVESGDYPGFVVTLPGDIDGDFHGRFEGGDQNERLAGLIDIAQEKNHVFIRQPAEAGNPMNIPDEPALESNRRFYPDTDFASPASLGDTTGDRHTASGFNLDRPEAGDPVPENATGLLIRYVKWMHEVIGADGFRIDAEKHIPQFFFNDFYDGALAHTGPGGSTPFSFGEVFDTNFGLLSSYTRKDGFGNRDVLDFPLYYRMLDVFNANGFGDMRTLEFASFDGSDGDANDGSRGVQFVSSHDNGPPAADNLAYAHILTRAGYPVVYFNALEFGTGRDFPQRGRGDALGGEFGDLITRLVGIHHEYGRGAHRTRWIDSDVYICERESALLVGLNDNGASDQTRTVDTGFRNVTLVELTGNPGATNPVVIGADGRATVTIPSNGGGRGYAMWGLAAPRGLGANPFAISPVASTIAPDPPSVPNGIRRITLIEVVTADAASLTLSIDPQGLDDNAILRVDDGSVNAVGTPIFGGGEFAQFQDFPTGSPSFGGGSGVYAATLDISALGEGNHYLTAVAFLHREPDTLPVIYQTFRRVICVDRTGPPIELLFPSRTGSADIQSTEYEAVLRNPDNTADSLHVLLDFAGSDEEAIAAVSSENSAVHFDRNIFRFNLTNLTPGLHSLTAVAFEPTGNVSVTRFGNIDVLIPIPETRFVNLPSTINTAQFDDIQVQVSFVPPGGGDNYVFDPTGTQPNSFNVQLTVDGVVYPAQAFDPGLIGSTNTLYQNDTDFGDDFDTFRFNWRGYGPGFHQFEAKAMLNGAGAPPPAIVTRSVEISDTTPGPDFDIIDPPPPDGPNSPPKVLLISPTSIAVTLGNLDPSARSIAAFIQSGESEQMLGTLAVDGTQPTVTLTGSPNSAELFNGTAIIRVQATTDGPGTGIVTEKSTAVLILGANNFVPPATDPVVDGQDNDWPGTPSSTIHTVTLSDGEWIYTGGEDDERTDLGDDPDIANHDDAGDRNMDLTELRIRPSASDLFFLARLTDVTDVHRPSFAIAIDTDTPADATSLNFIGDESGTLLDTSDQTYDFTIQVHFSTPDVSHVEVFSDDGDGRWFSPPGEASFVSQQNRLIEFSIPRSVLGLTGASPQMISIQGATFENVVGWNNDVDSTRDIGAGPDAVDVVGGEEGVADNAYGRAFGDGNAVIDNPDPNVILTYDITIPPPSESGTTPPPAIQSVAPPDLSAFAATTPVPVTVETDLAANSLLLAVNAEIVAATSGGESGEVRTWTAATPALQSGANSVVVVGFANPNFTGQVGIRNLTYDVNLPEITLDQLINDILGIESIPEERRQDADLNGDGEVDSGDVVKRINNPPAPP